MKRGLTQAVLAGGLVLGLATATMAQGPGGRGGMGMGMGGGASLMGNPSVQKELKLDDTQVEKVRAIVEGVREEMGGLRDQLEDVPQNERMAKMQDLMKPINEKAIKKAEAVLKPEQVKRFHQIELQQRPIAAFTTDKDLAKKLGITKEQEDKIKGIVADSMADMRDARESAGDDRQEWMRKTQEITKKSREKVMALMTDDQKKMWKEMTGEPFEMTGGMGGGRPGGRGR